MSESTENILDFLNFKKSSFVKFGIKNIEYTDLFLLPKKLYTDHIILDRKAFRIYALGVQCESKKFDLEESKYNLISGFLLDIQKRYPDLEYKDAFDILLKGYKKNEQ